jgi:hypothetical protein
MIPKIIHQMGPEDKNEWHPIWQECQESWKEQFPEPFYEHVFWTDGELRELVKNDYPEFLKLYDDFPVDAFRIDFSRFCILHKYGGIYADLDFYCYKNFYKELKDDIYLLESREIWDEIVQNSLMASCPQHEFWILAMEESKRVYYNLPEKYGNTKGVEYFNNFLSDDVEIFCTMVKKTTGPGLLGSVYQNIKTSLFPIEEYHPFDHGSFFRNGYEISKLRYEELKYKYEVNSKVKCRHFLSGIWGNEIRVCSRIHGVRPDEIKVC